MKSFLRKVLDGEVDKESKAYFLRFGKGNYQKRFLISCAKSAGKIKIKASFELANDFVKFIKENKDVKFSGKVLNRDKIAGKDGRKKGSSFIYEVSESSLSEFESPYFYLVDVNSEDIVLKIKKSLPKPGKEADKIDDKFCSLIIDEKYWDSFKEAFLWDAPEGKKIKVQNELIVDSVEIPSDAKTPEEIRVNAVRIGKIIRKIDVDGNEEEKEYNIKV